MGADEEDQLRDIDYILENFVGNNGPWQRRFLLLVLTVFGATYLLIFLHLFAAYVPDHRCRVPACEAANRTSYQETWLNFTIPEGNETDQLVQEVAPWDQCRHFRAVDPDGGSCEASNFDSDNATTCESGFVFDDSVFPETLSTKLDLVCDRKYLRRMLGTLMMLGLLLGSVLGGWLSDKIGRKKTLLIAVLVMGPSILISSLSPNYWMYAVLRLAGCTVLTVVWVSGNTIMVEGFGTSQRVFVVCAKDLWWPICHVILAGFAYAFRYWVHLHLAVGIVCLLAIPAWWFLPESYRWLAENKRKDEAMEVLRSIARGNGKTLSASDEEAMMRTLTRIEEASVHHGHTSISFLRMFRRDYVVTSLILICTWATVNVGSYTLTLNSTRLSGDLFLNFILAALGEMPATLILYFSLNNSRRLLNVAGSLWILGVCCLILAFIPRVPSMRVAILVFYLIGKCSVGASFLLVWLITSEIYPTNLRSQALGTCSTIARLFGLVCPFVSNLAVYWQPLPMVVLGLPALAFGTLSLLFLPETFGRPLPQNIDEAMEINKSNVAMRRLKGKREKK